MDTQRPIILAFLVFSVSVVHTATHPNDLALLNQFKHGLENAELLEWPSNGDDPCGPPAWPHIYCSGNRVSQIQVRGLGLKGPLPPNFNQLSMLQNLGLQDNHFTGELPSFNGLSELRYAYLDYNDFDTIPSDFFKGLVNLEVLALDYNPLNATNGWSLPSELQGSAQLKNLSLMGCNLAGSLPEFLGNMSSLEVLKLSLNRITGDIPGRFRESELKILWLNEQSDGMIGPIDVITSITSLISLWLHGNRFSGEIPDNIGDLVSLNDLNLNGNDLVGFVPSSLANMELQHLDLNNNHFIGSVPKFKAVIATYASNPFCLPLEGSQCSPDVMALLDFLRGLNYPSKLVESWSGNDPCRSWLGIGCDPNGEVITINLHNSNLSGALSSSIANLDSLTHIYLQSNNLSGPIPAEWTSLKSLVVLNLSQNNISPPIPVFGSNVELSLSANSLLDSNSSSGRSTNASSEASPSSPVQSSSSSDSVTTKHSSGSKLLVVVAPVGSFAVLVCLFIPLSVYFSRKRKHRELIPSPLVIHPRDPSDSRDAIKIVITDNTNRSASSLTNASGSVNSNASRVIEAGNLVISVQVLRNVTKNFAVENELGRGGFGVVYKGDLDDGTKIAVKRMEGGALSSKALEEFQSEIEVLSKVRHRHLVSLLGYSVEGNERILVYEYMPQGPLSKHLFHWKKMRVEPLSWKRRLNIALDVARGMEYLHSLAHKSFIHRDLKSSNILLGDDFRAKVSDFGLVKLAPDGEKSVATQLAGTFGYLAPEYAETGKITTKADVYSFGVILMELLSGMVALDEKRADERQYLVPWFKKMKSNEEALKAAIDPSLDVKGEAFESMSIICELAGHCTAREPGQRPDMGRAVNVLASLVEKWKPRDENEEEEEYCGIDYSLPLDEMVKGWQEAEGKEMGVMDTEGSLPATPLGFVDSFHSADAR